METNTTIDQGDALSKAQLDVKHWKRVVWGLVGAVAMVCILMVAILILEHNTSGHTVEICVYSFIAVMFVVLGIVMLCGKGAFLIAGFNTKSYEERAKYNVKALCQAMGVFAIALAVISVGLLVATLIDNDILMWTSYVAFAVAFILMLVYTNTSKRIKKRD